MARKNKTFLSDHFFLARWFFLLYNRCVTELETAQKRIADLEEEVAELTRQLGVMSRYVFGKRSEPEAPEGRRQTATQEQPAGRTRRGEGESTDAGARRRAVGSGHGGGVGEPASNGSKKT